MSDAEKSLAEGGVTLPAIVRPAFTMGGQGGGVAYTETELRILRKLTEADKVYWILPAGNEPKFQLDVSRTQNIIRRIAADYDDVVLPISRVEEDGINPNANGYKMLAERIKK